MGNQNVQQKQIKEIFILNNLTRVETTWNRRILKQLDVKLISLNHSVYSLQVEIGRLQIDRNFIYASNLNSIIHFPCGYHPIKQ